ncbi:MAG: cohesin domain-containing protein, partial [Candidatus Marinimicrobia bacterium]|nr:cohesin domain-containing protein [Candidatus Neomarinimicrobiota bacterium]
MKQRNFFLLLFMILPILTFAQGNIVLSLSDVEVDAYAPDVVVPVNLNNAADDVGGLQFDVIQAPNMLPLTDVVAVGRAEGFDVSFNDFGEGHIRVVLVSIAGGNIEAGDGGILELHYDASDVASAVVTLTLSDLIVSDPDGNELEASVGEPVIVSVGTTATLYVEGGTADAGEQIDIAVSLTNNAGVGGLQFDLVDTPNDLTVEAVSVTGRAEDFDVEWNEISGAVRVIVFDLENGSIGEGEGEIVSITASIGDFVYAGDINLTFDNIVVSDDLGGAIVTGSVSSTVTVYPGYLEPPVNLVAETGLDGHVPLVWEEPTGGGGGGGGGDPADLLIEIMTDNFAYETTWDLQDGAGNVIETGAPADNATLHTWEIELTGGSYTWTIYDSYGDGICCAYGEGYYNIYVGGDLIATGGEFAYEESVSFDTGGRVMSISHGSYAEPHGYAKGEVLPDIDIPIIIETTVYEQPKSGLNLAEWDAGGENDTYNVTRDLEAYSIYRSTTSGSGYELVDVVDAGTLNYDDVTVENGTWYYYVVSADYGEMGESGYSNEAAALPAEWVTMSLSNGAAISGYVDTIYVSLENASTVAEFSFTINDIPNAVVAQDVVTTDRTAGFNVEFSELAGGSMTASFSGGEVTPGEGPVAAIAYLASYTSEVVADLVFTEADAAGPEGNIFIVATEDGSFEVFIETQYAMLGGGYADPGGEGTVEL